MINLYDPNSQILLTDGSSKNISDINIGDMIVSDGCNTKVINKLNKKNN